ncbi:TPA: hypothetical protein I9080_002902 [Clostridium perfringens]|uniref:Phage protein n=1 Tax=Clostridium perfringens TaxID=1502 RepID=A0A8H9QZK6_CLOPF|nr:hypothetical protein [Clostridium perfringens]
MNIQGKVRVGSMDYDVILTDEKIINQDGEECLGLTDHNLHEIKISTRLQNEQGQEKTFLHELIHAMIAERNLDFECITEEILAEDLSTILYQVIKDNPEMFRKNIERNITTMWADGTCSVKHIIGQEPKVGYIDVKQLNKSARVTKEQCEDTIKLFKGRNINELSKKDIPELAEILSGILRREYNPHTQLIISPVSFRITEDVLGAPFDCKKQSEIKSNDIEKNLAVENLLEKIKKSNYKDILSNTLDILSLGTSEECPEYLIFNGENIPGVKSYSINKNEHEFPSVTITLDCPNINIVKDKKF